MKEFIRSLAAELAPVWMTQQEPQREGEPPLPAPGREPHPDDGLGKEPAPEPETIPPLDPDEQDRPITPVPPVR
ncbi:hypothetical protein I6F26_30280 [Ensifer sp. IC3342]|nr:hypothetical protein [Ensifer sp. BRP08]MCA1450800.1 hypothetical protein [Ensifer sp. IC3342]